MRAMSLALVAVLLGIGCPGRTAVPCNDDEDCGRNESCSLGFCRPLDGAPVLDAGVPVADAGTELACAPELRLSSADGTAIVCGQVGVIGGSSSAGGVRVDADPHASPVERVPMTSSSFEVR